MRDAGPQALRRAEGPEGLQRGAEEAWRFCHCAQCVFRGSDRLMTRHRIQDPRDRLVDALFGFAIHRLFP